MELGKLSHNPLCIHNIYIYRFKNHALYTAAYTFPLAFTLTLFFPFNVVFVNIIRIFSRPISRPLFPLEWPITIIFSVKIVNEVNKHKKRENKQPVTSCFQSAHIGTISIYGFIEMHSSCFLTFGLCAVHSIQNGAYSRSLTMPILKR